MEAISNRKRRAEDYLSPEIRRAVDRPPRGERAVDDKEVDEFFSILRRVREARRIVAWRPEFTLDDFREEKACRGSAGSGEVVSRSFDLNAEPVHEED